MAIFLWFQDASSMHARLYVPSSYRSGVEFAYLGELHIRLYSYLDVYCLLQLKGLLNCGAVIYDINVYRMSDKQPSPLLYSTLLKG